MISIPVFRRNISGVVYKRSSLEAPLDEKYVYVGREGVRFHVSRNVNRGPALKVPGWGGNGLRRRRGVKHS
jgi:hypothetical protein